MARFFGSVPGSSRSESHLDDVFQEETVGNTQQSEAAIALCSEVKADVRNLQDELDTLKEMVANLREKSDDTSTKGKANRQRLPAGLSKIVRSLHESARIKFEPSEMFSSPHNQEVADEMIHQVMEHHKESFCKEVVKRAVHRYYESRRRIFNDSKPERRNQVIRNTMTTRRRGFQKRLYDRRGKMLKTDAERVYWKQINQDYMSEESQDEGSGTISRHCLTWTSQQLQKIKAVLDKRLAARNLQVGRFFPKERVESTPSNLPLPKNPVKWAVKRTSQSSSHDQSENTPPVDPDNIERAALYSSQSDSVIRNERASHMEGLLMPLRELTQREDFTTPRRELTRSKDFATPCRYREVQSRRSALNTNSDFRSPVITTTHQRDTASPSQVTNPAYTRRPNHMQSSMSCTLGGIFNDSDSSGEEDFY